MKNWITGLVKYGMVGVVGTICHYIVFGTLLRVLNISPVSATFVGSICGAMVNHALNHYFVFKMKARLRSTALGFYLVAVLGIAINAGVVKILTELLRIEPWPSQLLATAVVFLVTYMINKRFTFSVAGKLEAKP